MPNTVPRMWGNSIKEIRHHPHSYGTCALVGKANNDYNEQVNVGDKSPKLPNMWEGMIHVGISEKWVSEHRREGKKEERRGNHGCVRRASSHQAGI